MPKRSTPFQKLVLHIQQSLSKHYTVEQSAMLTHRLTGEEREVDIAVRGSIGEHPILVCIECVEGGRPADVTWVEQMSSKHQHLPTNKLLLVSLSGFTAQAAMLCQRLAIDKYSPEELPGLDWLQVVGTPELTVAKYDFAITSQDLVITTPNGQQTISAGGDTVLVNARGERSTLGKFLLEMLHSEAFSTPAMNRATKDGLLELGVRLETMEAVSAVDTEGKGHPVAAFILHVQGRRVSAPLEIKSASWKGTPVAFGSGQTPLGKTEVTLVERAPGNIAIKVFANGKELEGRKPGTSPEVPRSN